MSLAVKPVMRATVRGKTKSERTKPTIGGILLAGKEGQQKNAGRRRVPSLPPPYLPPKEALQEGSKAHAKAKGNPE